MGIVKSTLWQLAALFGASQGQAAGSAPRRPSTGQLRVLAVNEELGRFQSLGSIEQLPTARFARPDFAAT